MRFRQIIYPLLLPLLIIITASLILWKWPDLLKSIQGIKELRALLIILPVLPYLVFAAGFLMGWRYNNIGLILSFAILALTYFTLLQAGTGVVPSKKPVLTVPEAVGFLLPLNLALFSTLTKRRILTTVFVVCILLIMVQGLAVLLFCSWPGSGVPALVPLVKIFSADLAAALKHASLRLGSVFHANALTAAFHWLRPDVMAFCLTLLFLLGRFLYRRDKLLAGFSGALLAVFLGANAAKPVPAMPIFFMAGGSILIIAAFEASFAMAYVDELTGLQGRRSLNETLLNLGSNYAIAMIDVDHFKKFNDTYGHKTGDQVLKMIAARLANLSGGAKTFRYGGEEFAAVFSGKTAGDAWPYLEEFRQQIADTPFVVRRKGRRKSSEKQRGAPKTKTHKTVQVTVSIGASSPDNNRKTPEAVLKAADKILYRAKKAGRNRVLV